MAPQKRKARSDDFFYYTIEDEEAVGDEDKPTSKKAKKADVVVEDEDDESVDEFDPTFEFFEGGSDVEFDEEEDTTAQGLGLKGADRIVDLNELIERRREEKEKKEKEKGKKKDESEEGEEGEEDWEDENEGEEDKEDDDDEDVDLDDADDEVLAADGFGMGVDEDEGSGKEDGEEDEEMAEGDDMDAEHGEDEDEDEDAASDNDSVATPVDHPEDDGSDAESESTDEDEEERARQEEFFAAGEQEKSKSRGQANGDGAGGASTVGSFQAMRLFSRPILRGIAAAGYETPTAIQAKTIPFAIGGHDVVGQAVTGSGKTAAFLLPILERLLHRPTSVPKTRVVVLTPTRELAVQGHKVAAKLASCTSITLALAVGGTSFKASEAGLRSRPDIVIATPGRFIDHMRNSPSFAVDGVEILVLDEADRMLQDGFADELNEIVRTLPRGRQTLLFSATMGASVDQLIRVGLHRPVRIQADAPGARTTSTMTQSFVRLRPGREDKRLGYLVQLCTTLYRDHAIIFFREKRSIHEARIVFGLLGLSCEELHGNIRQAERLASLESFRRGAVRFLLASDLASRGLDIKGVETVINYEVPKNLEDYIHRIGRTARAGRRGVAVTIVAEQDRKFVKEVVKAMRGTDKKMDNNEKVPRTRIRSQQVDPAAADAWQAKIDAMADDVEAVVQDERQARALARAEMEATRGENMLKHRDEIMARPKRTWFESARDKEAKRQQERRQVGAGRSEEGKTSAMERLRDQLKAKHGGTWLSRKDTKKLDAKKDRLEGLGGRKLKQEKKQMGSSGNTKAKGKVIKGGKAAKGLRGPKVKGARAKAGAKTGAKGKGRR